MTTPGGVELTPVQAGEAVVRCCERRPDGQPVGELEVSMFKAALIIAYFMHMKFEVTAMKWVTMSSLVFCLAMMLVFLPDAFRILHLGVQ